MEIIPRVNNIVTISIPHENTPILTHTIQLIILFNNTKYNGILCQIQNLNVNEDRIIKQAGIIDVYPIADKNSKSIPQLANIVPIKYIIAKNQGIIFKDNKEVLYKTLSTISFLVL